MKINYTSILATLFILGCGIEAIGQKMKDYTVSLPNGKLILEDINDLIVEGYSGTEVKFSSQMSDQDISDRAEGLRLINNYGMTDNTGLGISVEKSGDVVTATQMADNDDERRVTVSVPQGVDVYISHGSHEAETILVKNFSRELEITTNYHDVRFENVTGPMAIKTVYGDIEGSFSNLNQSGSISMYAVYSHVDVTIPESAQANLTLSTSYGDVYSNANIDIQQKKKPKDSCGNSYTGGDIMGTINGGGVDFTLKSSYENVYLRTQ